MLAQQTLGGGRPWCPPPSQHFPAASQHMVPLQVPPANELRALLAPPREQNQTRKGMVRSTA